MLIEVVGDIKEFLSKVNPNYTLHYEVDARTAGAMGEIAIIRFILYGLADDRIVICEIARMASWDDEEVERFSTGNAMDNLRLWVEEMAEQFECMAVRLNATRGKYEWKC